MLIYEPGKRISAKQALKHPYFNDLRLSTPATGFNNPTSMILPSSRLGERDETDS